MMPASPLMPLDDFQHLLPLVVPRQDAIGEVGPVEVADEHQRIAQRELLGDVAPHLRRRRGRVGVDRGLGERLAQIAKLPVLRAEVVAPVADAVRLVDGERPHVRRAAADRESCGMASRSGETKSSLSLPRAQSRSIVALLDRDAASC